MTKSEVKAIKGYTVKIDRYKKQLATTRDKLREVYEDLGGFLDGIDEGVDDITTGVSYIESALNSISQEI